MGNPRGAENRETARILRKNVIIPFLHLNFWPLRCVSPTKNIQSGLAPTNCKLVFNSTSFQIDYERIAIVGVRLALQVLAY